MKKILSKRLLALLCIPAILFTLVVTGAISASAAPVPAGNIKSLGGAITAVPASINGTTADGLTYTTMLAAPNTDGSVPGITFSDGKDGLEQKGTGANHELWWIQCFNATTDFPSGRVLPVQDFTSYTYFVVDVFVGDKAAVLAKDPAAFMNIIFDSGAAGGNPAAKGDNYAAQKVNVADMTNGWNRIVVPVNVAGNENGGTLVWSTIYNINFKVRPDMGSGTGSTWRLGESYFATGTYTAVAPPAAEPYDTLPTLSLTSKEKLIMAAPNKDGSIDSPGPGTVGANGSLQFKLPAERADGQIHWVRWIRNVPASFDTATNDDPLPPQSLLGYKYLVADFYVGDVSKFDDEKDLRFILCTGKTASDTVYAMGDEPWAKDGGSNSITYNVNRCLVQNGWNKIIIPLMPQTAAMLFRSNAYSTMSDEFMETWGDMGEEYVIGRENDGYDINRISTVMIKCEQPSGTYIPQTPLRLGSIYVSNEDLTIPGATTPPIVTPPTPTPSQVTPTPTNSADASSRATTVIRVEKTDPVINGTFYSDKRGYKGSQSLKWWRDDIPADSDDYKDVAGKTPLNANKSGSKDYEFIRFKVFIEDYNEFKSAKAKQDAKFDPNDIEKADKLWLWFRVSSNLDKNFNECLYRYEDQITKTGWNTINMAVPKIDYSTYASKPGYNSKQFNGQLGIKEMFIIHDNGCDYNAITSMWWTLEGTSFNGKFELADLQLVYHVEETVFVDDLPTTGANDSVSTSVIFVFAIAGIAAVAVVFMQMRKKSEEVK